MIGMILIIICLSIVFLTTPNARKKISKLYNNFIPKFKVAVLSYKERNPRLFRVRKQLSRLDLPGAPAITRSVTLEPLSVESDVSANGSFLKYVNEPETEPELIGVNVIETIEDKSNQQLAQNITEKTSNDIAPNMDVQIAEQSIKEALTQLMVSLITDIYRRSDSLNEESDAFNQEISNVEKGDHSVVEEEYISKHFGDIHLVSNTSQNVTEQTSNDIAPNIDVQIAEQSTKEALTQLMVSLITDIYRRSDSLNEELHTFNHDISNVEKEDHSVMEEEHISRHFGDIYLISNASISQDELTDPLKQLKNNILPPESATVKLGNAIGFIYGKAEEQDTINNYEEDMNLHDIPSNENKVLILEEHDGIIDIDQDDEIIDFEDLSLGISINIPSWPHRYIYSVSDLDYASQEQKNFYKKFKHAFHQGRYIDTLGNSNYYFILLFDLFEDYKIHQDLKLLEKLIDIISIEYPRTIRYARRFLLDKMYEVANRDDIARLESKIVEGNSYMSWDWQSRYRDKLNLSKEDQKILVGIYLPTNTFTESSFCATELVKLYIRTIKVLNQAYLSKGLQKDNEFGIVLDLIARKEYRYHLNSPNYNYQVKNNSNTIYSYILKYCEQLLRSFYHFKKLSSFDRQYSHVEVNEAIKEHVLEHIETSLSELMAEVATLDSSTERFLYTLHPTRWKSILRLDEAFYLEKGNEEFIRYAETIIALNNSNTSLENVFLELSRFLAGLDKQKSLEYFLRYTDQNILAKKLVLKEMAKTISRRLFKDSESHLRYITLLTKLMRRELTIEEALLEVKGFYEPIRKKIHLDQKVIQKVQQDFTGTVDLLGEFLSDDSLEEIEVINVVPAENVAQVEAKIEIINKYLIEVTQVESDLLDLFNINSYSVSKAQIAEYCHSTGSMQNVLINNINEKFYDVIDDLLIEDGANSFTIDGNYYAQIKNI